MKRLVVVSLLIAAAMALAPSVAEAKSSPARSLPIRSAPIVKTSPIAAKPARWSYMWLRAVKFAPAVPFAPMPSLERSAALRTSALRIAILKLHSQAR